MITRRKLFTIGAASAVTGAKKEILKVTNSRPLSVNASTQLDGSGSGVASEGPTGYGETWSNVTVSVHCSSNVNEAQCLIYVGDSPSPANFADGTTFGSTGDSSTNLPPVILAGQSVWAVWTGGDANATGYLNIKGTDNVA